MSTEAVGPRPLVTMAHLAVRSLRQRLPTFAGTLVTLALAVVVLTVCGTIIDTASHARPRPQRYANTDVLITGSTSLSLPTTRGPEAGATPVTLAEPRRIPLALAEEIRGLPEVASIIADTVFEAQLVGRRGEPVAAPPNGASVGRSWSAAPLAPFTIVEGRAPVGDGDVVIDAALARRADLHVGAVAIVSTPAGPKSFWVTGLAQAASPEGQRDAPLFFADTTVGRLSHAHGLTDVLAVVPRRGVSPDDLAERLSARLVDRPGVRVLTGSAVGDAEPPAGVAPRADVIALFGSVAGFAAMAACIVIASTIGLNLRQRGRELGMMRSIGTTPGQVRALLAAETLGLSTLAGVVGLPAGIATSAALVPLLVDHGMLLPGTHVALRPMPGLAAAGSVAIIALLATLIAGRRVNRPRPIAVLQHAALEPRRLSVVRIVAGLLVAGGALALLGVGLRLGGENGAALTTSVSLILIMAVGLLGPLLVRPAAAALGPLAGPGVTGRLARAAVRRNARRTAAVVLPLSLTLAFSTTILGLRTTLDRIAASDHASATAPVDLVLRGRSEVGVPEQVVARVASLPGVRGVAGLLPLELAAFGRKPGRGSAGRPIHLSGVGVDGRDLDQVLDLHLKAGSLDRLDGPTMAISAMRAREQGWTLGATVGVWFPDGGVEQLRIAAIYDRNFGVADVLVPRRVAERQTAHRGDRSAYVAFVDRRPSNPARRAVTELLAATPGLAAQTADAERAAFSGPGRDQATGDALLLGLVTGFTAVAVMNTLAVTTAARRQELALLRLVGATDRQVLRSFRREHLLVLAIGIVWGLAIAAVGIAGLSISLTGGLSGVAVPARTIFVGTGALSVLAYASAMIPARRGLRSPPLATFSDG